MPPHRAPSTAPSSALEVDARSAALLMAWSLGMYGALLGLPQHPAQEEHLLLSARATQHLAAAVSDGASLVHLVTGLLTRSSHVALERIWAMVVAIIPVAFCAALWRWLKGTLGTSAADIATWAFAVSPLVFLTLLPLALVPLVAASALALFAASEWVEGHSLLSANLFAIAAIATHPIALPLLVVCVLLSQTRKRALLNVPSIALATYAFSARFDALTQSTHFAHESWLRALLSGASFTVAFITAALVPRARVLAFAVVVCLGLSAWLGAALAWLWCATVLATACIGVLGADFATTRKPLLFLGILSAAGAAWAPGHDWSTSAGTRRTALNEARLVLERPEAAAFEYLTVGLGAERFGLARRVAARTASLGLEVDGLAFNQPEPRATFERVLRERGEHVRWVLSGTAYANDALVAAGFAMRAAWRGELTLWEREAATAIDRTSAPTLSRADVARTTLMLAALSLGAVVWLVQTARRLRRSMTAASKASENTDRGTTPHHPR